MAVYHCVQSINDHSRNGCFVCFFTINPAQAQNGVLHLSAGNTQ